MSQRGTRGSVGFDKKGSQVIMASEFDDSPRGAPSAQQFSVGTVQAEEAGANLCETAPEEDGELVNSMENLEGLLPGDGSSAAGQAQQVVTDQLNDKEFLELHLSSDHMHALRSSFQLWLSVQSPESIGEALHGAFSESMPSLLEMWKSPRAVMSSRMFQAFRDMVNHIDSPAALKERVEMLAFMHLQMDVTAPRVWFLRDALLDLLAVELGDQFATIHREAWSLLMSYIGGAFIFIRQQFSGRLNILLSSWIKVTSAVSDGGGTAGDVPAKGSAASGTEIVEHGKDHVPKTTNSGFRATSVPKTFDEMFVFNAAVMGYGSARWMHDVLSAFGPIVLNIANPARWQEECDVLSLVLAKFKGPISLKDYKSVMLASLRSLLPQDWSSEHEHAGAWLWESVERALQANMGKPAVQEQALLMFTEGLSEDELVFFRTKTYELFFEKCPKGQDYFKQSAARLHFIADKVLAFTKEIYKDTHDVIQALSALGLRHVGYGIPTELFGPFVSSAIEAMKLMARPERKELSDSVTSLTAAQKDGAMNEMAVEAFSWSLSLVSRVLVRTITEGSTIVMKAINANDARMLKRAVTAAPRGQRAQWVLRVQVGAQQISPLMWAVQSGALEAAKAILEDICAIRADRETYYYAVDDLFKRHPDIVERLRLDAPSLLEVLFDGLIWRSRLTQEGRRRVNYYVKNLIVDKDGHLSQSLASIVNHDDPVIVCHPAVVLVLDNIWSQVARKTFLWNKLFFLVSLITFILAMSLLIRYDEVAKTQDGKYAIFACRLWYYFLFLPTLMFSHAKNVYKAIKEHDWVRYTSLRLPFPRYLLDWQEVLSLCLMCGLFVMCVLEPAWRCSKGRIDFPCPAAADVVIQYRWTAMFCNLIFFLMALDLMVLSTDLSAYVLACRRVISEVLLCLAALSFNIVLFALIINCQQNDLEDFAFFHTTIVTLMRITLGIYSSELLNEAAKEVDLLLFVSIYSIISWVFLLNLLVGQMNCLYMASYNDMVGFARLNRGRIVLKTMPTVKPSTWQAYVKSLRLDEKLEFNEGDLGLAGGLQCFEPGSLHRVTEEQIKRYGGPTNPDAPWPEETEGPAEIDRILLLEKSVQKGFGKLWKALSGKGRSSASGASHSSFSRGSAGSDIEGSSRDGD